MTPRKKLVLRILAGFYVLLIAAFFVQSFLGTQAESSRQTLSEKLIGATLKEPLPLKSLDGKPATATLVDSLTSARVSSIGTSEAEPVAVNPALVGHTLHNVALPAGTMLTEALWFHVLEPEHAFRQDAGLDSCAVIGGTEAGVLRSLDAQIVGSHLTEPLELKSLDGRPATAEQVKALSSAKVSVISTAKEPASIVAASLVGKTFKKPVLPAETTITEELWTRILQDEKQVRLAANDSTNVYVRGSGNIMNFDMTLLFVVVNFLGLLVLLRLFLWEPILKVLDDRAATVKADLDSAAGNRQESEELKAKYGQLLLGSRQERQQLIAEGRKQGEAERQLILGEARQEAERIIAQTKQELEAAAAKVRTDLQSEVGNLSLQIAEQILHREVRQEDNEKLVQDFLGQLKTSDLRN
jgi:F-type H+-transporting ATPase subunit b